MNQLEMFLSFIKFEKRYSDHTLISYQTDLEQFKTYMKLTYEQEDIVDVSHSFIRSWMVSLINAGDKATTINRKISTLKSFYKYLLKKEAITVNPTSKLTRPKTPKKLPTFIDENAAKILMTNIEADGSDMENYRDMVMMEMLYSTGIRRSELMNLTMNNVDASKLQIKVYGKGKKERIVPISSELFNKVEKLVGINFKQDFTDKEDFIFLTIKGKKIYPELIYQTIKKQLSHVTTTSKKSPHVMRHTFATHLLNNGADLNAIKDLMGHSSLASTQVYTHNSIEKLKNVYKQAHPKAQ
jgi:integrase/recombinase XerC